MAVSTDALRTTRPIRTKVETPDEINEVFDAIAYQKTASVLRTIENFVGPELFRKGVASYLRKFSFANAAGEDFWTEVARVTGKPVDRIMKPYIEQPGVPVVSINARCLGNTTDIALHQDKFVGVPGAAASAPRLSGRFRCASRRRAAPRRSARCSTAAIRRRRCRAARRTCSPTPTAAATTSPNTRPTKVRALARTARGSLAPAERLNLLGDEWWIVRAGRNDIGVYLDLASSLAGDDVAPVTQQIAGSLAFTGEYIVTPADATRFQGWVRERFTPELNALGLPGNASDTDETQSRRAALLSLLGVTGNSTDVQQRARALALTYIDDRQSLPATLASTVLDVAAIGGDAMLYDRYVAQLPEALGQARGVLPLLQRAAVVPRPRARAAHAAVCRLARRPHAGHRTADRRSALASLVPRCGVDVRQGAVGHADQAARDVPGNSAASWDGSAASARATRPPTSGSSSRRIPCPPWNARFASRSSAWRIARRSPSASRPPRRRGSRPRRADLI